MGAHNYPRSPPGSYPRCQPYNCTYCGKFGFRIVGAKSVNYLPFCSAECKELRRLDIYRERTERLKNTTNTKGDWFGEHPIGERKKLSSIPSPTAYELKNM